MFYVYGEDWDNNHALSDEILEQMHPLDEDISLTNFMTTDLTRLTAEEIAQYKNKFEDYPEALEALELISETDGDLIESGNLLASEAGIKVKSRGEEQDNILDELAKKCRNIICDEVFINDLIGGWLTAGVASLAATGNISAAAATPVVIYLAKKGVKQWCQSEQN